MANRWTRERVTALRSHHKIPVFRPAPDGTERWLNLTNAARLCDSAGEQRAATGGRGWLAFVDTSHSLRGLKMQSYFESPFRGIALDKQVANPNILVGRFSYYSGYYHGHSFDDCARYLLPDEGFDCLIIGSFCSIGSGAAIIMAGNQGHRCDWVSTFPFYWMSDVREFKGAENGFRPAGDTVIGNDVWIGSEAIVMPGVKIGDGAVIGTRAVVTREVEPHSIVGAHPAKEIRKRFDDGLVDLLLELRWWE